MPRANPAIARRALGGSVKVANRKNVSFVRYIPTSARTTADNVLGLRSYCDAQRVIKGTDGKIYKIGGYRVLVPSGNISGTISGRTDAMVFRQLTTPEGEDIPGEVYPFDKKSLPMSHFGIPVREDRSCGGIATVAASDFHGEAYRMAQLIFEFLDADKILVNGDIVDRGPGWWRIYMALTSFIGLLYNWGNHDAMWFGAGVGNKALVAELFRWLFRYNEQGPFADKFGLNFDKLEAYARKHYADATGSFKAKVKKDGVEVGKMMEAALTTIKLKLEAQDRYPAPETPLEDNELRILEALRHKEALKNLTPVDRQLFDRLTGKQRFGLDKTQKTRFKELQAKTERTEDETQEMEKLVALDKEGKNLLDLVLRMKAGDRALNEEEQAIVDDLTEQLLNSKLYREMTLWFIETGGMYTIADGNLYTHSHYPVDKEGNLRAIDGKVGQEAFDAITARVKKIGAALRVFHETGERSELDKVQEDVKWVRFLAWDYESPLYGRVMQTWERAYLKEESGTYDEPEDPFYAFMEPKMPEPKDPKIKKDKKKLQAWQQNEGKAEMDKYNAQLEKGRVVLQKILLAFGLDPNKASLIKGHKPDKGDKIGKPTVHCDGQYLNIDAVMSGPAADIEEGYGILLVTTEQGQLIEVSLAPQRREIVKE